MKSIRTKTTFLMVSILVIAMTVATTLGEIAIQNIGNSDSEQMLQLQCEAGEKKLDSYFISVEQSVEIVSAYVESDLETMPDRSLEEHLEHVKGIFTRLTEKTSGVLTYYYRIDPAVSDTAKGFWFVDLEKDGFQEHEVTDISLYDTDNTSQLVWFTVPKVTGSSIWLPPYITENLNVRVISYNTPIYRNNEFIGVIGIEIDYATLAQQVDSIRLYQSGYAFLTDEENNIIYHPHMDVTTMEPKPKGPGTLSSSGVVRYKVRGVEMQARCMPLNNGMILNVTVPVSEIHAGWHGWVRQIFIVSLALLGVFIIITLQFTERITKPLHQLTMMAEEVNAGNYELQMDCKGNDEVAVLTRAFNQLIAHLKTYITDLNNLAYSDALTSVHNKGAFNLYLHKLQNELTEELESSDKFAIVVFDCNGLKTINDQEGHDKGDLYLRSSCALICDVFRHSPVFRIGGDEFVTILQRSDYEHREELLVEFDVRCAETREKNHYRWDQLDVARGMAVYSSEKDISVSDVVRRADDLMYINKRARKRCAASGTIATQMYNKRY